MNWNKVKTFVMLVLLSVLLVAVCARFSFASLLAAGIFVVTINVIIFWHSDKVISAYYGDKIRKASLDVDDRVMGMVEKLVENAGIPIPDVYILRDDKLNAFATGRGPSSSLICLSTGILTKTDSQVEGVIGHELAHIKNYDILIMTAAAIVGGTITIVCDIGKWFVFSRDNKNWVAGLVAFLSLLLAPVAALLIQMTISRSCEFEADAEGARIAGDTEGLASALLLIEGNSQIKATSTMAHMCICSPLDGGVFEKMFSTHPPINERVRRLKGMTL